MMDKDVEREYFQYDKEVYLLETCGDDLDYTSTIYNKQGASLGSLNWGFSSGWIPDTNNM